MLGKCLSLSLQFVGIEYELVHDKIELKFDVPRI